MKVIKKSIYVHEEGNEKRNVAAIKSEIREKLKKRRINEKT